MAALLTTKTYTATTSFGSIFGGAVGTSTEYIVTGLRVANKTTMGATYEVKLKPGTGDEAWIASTGTSLPAGAADELTAGGSYSLATGDDIQIKAGAGSAITVLVTYKSRSTA